MVHLRPLRRPHRCGCSDCLLHPRGATARAHRDINRLLATLDERRRRLFVGFLAREQGRGAIRRLARVTGLSRNTIRRGLREWRRPTLIPGKRLRRPGGGPQPGGERGEASPRRGMAHGFPSGAEGPATPYGIYDLACNEGYVVVGTSHDTPTFAVAAIRRWWLAGGRHRYHGAKRLLIEADSGGSNDYRKWGWKV